MDFRKIILFIALFFVAHTAISQKDYDRSWKKIDSLINKSGLAKSALSEVNILYTKAKQENNNAQLIKALIYKSQLADQISDSNTTFVSLEKEITATGNPSRAILQSILASAYYNFLMNNRYKFYNRTSTVNFIKTDPLTWTITDLHNKISSLYLSSLSDPLSLQKISTGNYEAIIEKGNTRNLRPTLFDLLAHRALDYFRSDENDITKPAYHFEIDDKAVFDDADKFAVHHFTTKDTTSSHYQALLIFQDLLSFHLKDENYAALNDADLERLEFVRNYSVLENKDSLYKRTIENIIDKNPNAPENSRSYYLLADLYNDLAASFDPISDTANRYAYNEAERLCLKGIALSPDNEGGINCYNLLNNIRSKHISLESEKVNIPGEPFRTLIKYANASSAYFRILKIDRKTRKALGISDYQNSSWKKALALPVFKTFSYNIPDTKDHQQHRVEIKVDGLPAGEYALLVSTGKDFDLANDAMALQYIYVSGIAYINSDSSFYVLNRKTGAPLPGANVNIWENKYDYKKQASALNKIATYTTDKDGFFNSTRPANASPGSNEFEIIYKNDKLFMDDRVYTYSYYPGNTPDSLDRVFLFTDRSIYRPGQTVYFKGIAVSKKNNKASAIADRRSTIILYDANGQQIDSLLLTTNNFGSYSGKFVLPKESLNGFFTIKDKFSVNNVGFNVEEYKRPKFYVEIPELKNTYKLGDSIIIEGSVKSYAGNIINNAKVQYTVTRRQLNIYYESFYSNRIRPPYREPVDIIHGETQTDANGRFIIKFTAIPDRSIPVKSNPEFNFSINTDVTDISGETRSGSSGINIGYKALKLVLNTPETTLADSFRYVSPFAVNQNGIKQKSQINLNVYSLSTPEQVFRERFWDQPDQFVMSREEYHKYFPYDLYSDENVKSKWPKDKLIFSSSATSGKDSLFHIPRLSDGYYLIASSTKDQFGNDVTDSSYVLVIDKKLSSPESMQLLQTNKNRVDPGEEINWDCYLNLDSTYLIQRLSFGQNQLKRKIIPSSSARYRFSFKPSEEDRGLAMIDIAFVKNNRFYYNSSSVAIPSINSRIKIDYSTYRDKIEPGKKETWKVKISGSQKERISSELLTAMYDASLDQFRSHAWNIPAVLDNAVAISAWSSNNNFETKGSEDYVNEINNKVFRKEYDRLLDLGNPALPGIIAGRIHGVSIRGRSSMMFDASAGALNEVVVSKGYAPAMVADAQNKMVAEKKNEDDESKPTTGPSVQPRTNLNETAFFFPDLHTDSSGNIEFSFTTPEALTTWKWMLLAHTKNLAFGYDEKTIITQKELMVQPNAPRFLRQGDLLNLSSKVVNMTDKEISVTATLQLTDAITGKNIDVLFKNESSQNTFKIAAGQSMAVNFPIHIPIDFNNPVTYRIIATSGSLSDGEESLLPVLSNKTMVTETLPLPINGSASKNFSFEKLLRSGSGNSLQQNGIIVEFTSNPAWYAVQALPYLTEGEKENAEQVFNRYYANAIASKIISGAPNLKKIIEKWNDADASALLSNLQKNEELKSALLQETPWVLEAKTEAQQKKNIALLFDIDKMSSQLKEAASKLRQMQSPSGGFVWCKGGPEDRYMTQYILTGIGHLVKLGALEQNDDINSIIKPALNFIDQQIKKDYNQLKKLNKKLPATSIDNITAQHLYMRGLFMNIGVPGDVFTAYNYYRNQSKTSWVKQNSFTKSMIALSLFRTGDPVTANKIMKSLKETAIDNGELGTYWKDMTGGYYWYEAPIETQSLLIEAFAEIKDSSMVNNLKTWLLKNKQTNNWKTSKATADACYALLLQGSDWTTSNPSVEINLGDKKIVSANTEAGTGYFKQYIPANEVKPSMGNISVKVSNSENKPSWGAVYWQYFENMDKITASSTPLQLNKKLFIEKNTDRGPVLEPLENNTVHTGDKIKVRIELRSDRNMEYVHMRDMRASCMEPVNVLSEYKWQGGLGYYETTKDASTDFFFASLPKGVYVFEYSLFVSASGTFSNGITTIQCMYAPEFTSHSEGIKLQSLNK